MYTTLSILNNIHEKYKNKTNAVVVVVKDGFIYENYLTHKNQL
jgi:putative cell wall-binding protein